MRTIFLLSCLMFSTLISAQVIPGNTGYAVPAEKDEEDLFTAKGLEHWTDTKQIIQYYFYLRNTGTLEFSLKLKNSTAGNKIKASIAGKDFTISIPKNNNFQLVKVGSININTTGFYGLTLQAVNKTGINIADVQTIELSGTATKDIHFNAKPRRNAASVHLHYPLPHTTKVIQFYNEITVPETSRFCRTNNHLQWLFLCS